MRLPGSEHTGRPWRIHSIAHDFRVEDVWALATPGGPDDFPRLIEQAAALDPGRGSSRATRGLFAIRWKLGELFGWDEDDTSSDDGGATLRGRLPDDLRDAPLGPEFALPFSPLYLTDDEFAAELANRTMHGVIHLGWVEDGSGGYRGQMAVLVKPNGPLGRVYMAAIAPFRHLIVYPRMMRDFGRAWERRSAQLAVTE
jgi:hypothetical protein